MQACENIGFIGVGAMGEQMVANLATKSPPTTKLYINDVNHDVVDKICARFKDKVYPCATAKEVAEKSEVVMTMLPEGRHVREVYLKSPTSISSAGITGKIFIDCSTIDVATSLEVGKEIRRLSSSAAFYDAPVSGGVLGAKKCTLGVYLGCKEDDQNFPLLRSLLSRLGSNIIPCGGPSLGVVSKLCNNYLSGTIGIATAEAMNTGMRAGVDPRVLANVISVGTGKNEIADKFNPVPGIVPTAPSSNGYTGGFRVELMQKDYRLATELAATVGAKLLLGQAGLNAYTAASEHPECRGFDSKIVYRYLGGDEDWEKNAGADKAN